MAKSWMDKLINSIFDADWMGRRGERLTERKLKLVKLFERRYTILLNYCIFREMSIEKSFNEQFRYICNQ